MAGPFQQALHRSADRRQGFAQDVQTLQQTINTDPGWQRLMAEADQLFRDNNPIAAGRRSNWIKREARARGLVTPEWLASDFHFDRRGQLRRNESFPWVSAITAMGAPFAAAYLPGMIAANASGAAGAGAGTGAGAGMSVGAAGTIPAAAAAGGGLGSLAPVLSGAAQQFLSPQGLATLAGAFSRPDNIADNPNVNALLQQALKRQERVDPLHESVTRLATAMMPTGYRPQGGS